MTNEERKEKINELNSMIQSVLMPNVFTLNNTVLKIQKEIDQLQSECPHEYNEGYCNFCNKEKEGE